MVLITEVNVPDSVTSIGNGAFKGCNAIEKITLPFVGQSESATGYSSVFGYIFGTTSTNYATTYKMSSSTEYITQGYCHKYDYLYGYYVPKTIREVTITTQVNIPNNAFQNCDLIEIITIPITTETIGSYAFYECNGLTRLNSEEEGVFNIPETVVNIKGYAFYGCSQAVEFTMGEIKSKESRVVNECGIV
jgi:hypothetical protein